VSKSPSYDDEFPDEPEKPRQFQENGIALPAPLLICFMALVANISDEIVSDNLYSDILGHLQRERGSTYDFVGSLSGRGSQTSLAGMAMFIGARRGIYLAIGCQEYSGDIVSIPIPQGVTVADLKSALRIVPYPAIILAVLRAAEVNERPVTADISDMFNDMTGDFLTALVDLGMLRKSQQIPSNNKG